MADDGRQYADEFALTGEDDGRGAVGTGRRIGAKWVGRGAVIGEVSGEVEPPRDAAVGDEGGLVRVRRAPQEYTGSQPLVPGGQVPG